MKKEKLLVKEINVLSEVISKRVSDERKKMMDEKVGKDKEYKLLEKKVDEYNKKLKEMEKLEKGFNESIDKIRKRLNLGSGYDDISRIGNVGCNNVIGSYNKEFRVYYSNNSLSCNEVYNRLMIENIDGDLNVNDLMNRMIKEFVGK